MNVIIEGVNFILHIDRYVGEFIQQFGGFVYFILFGIVFVETGLVVTPFLPGDSLLFVSGAFAAQGAMSIGLLFLLFCLAAILGDSLNYWIGDYFGENVFAKSRFFNKEHLEKTKRFYSKHGNRMILFARFVPIVRTFAPFVAGVGKMKYRNFLTYNIVGGIVWVTLFLFAGFLFGNVPFVKDNLTGFIFAIIIASFIPIFVEWWKNRKSK